MARSGLKVVIDQTSKIADAIKVLAETKVMVGVPADKALRKDGGPINNAALAYIHNGGAPEAHIPARAFMEPGIKSVRSQIIAGLGAAGRLAFSGQPQAVTRQFHIVGGIARDAIRGKLGSNLPPPLALSTVLGRIRRRKSAKWKAKKRAAVEANLAAGKAPASGLFIALVDTAAMRNSISYVLRKVRGG